MGTRTFTREYFNNGGIFNKNCSKKATAAHYKNLLFRNIEVDLFKRFFGGIISRNQKTEAWNLGKSNRCIKFDLKLVQNASKTIRKLIYESKMLNIFICGASKKLDFSRRQ